MNKTKKRTIANSRIKAGPMHKRRFPKAPFRLRPPLCPLIPFHQAWPLDVLGARFIKGPPQHSRNPYRVSDYTYVFGTVPEYRSQR